MPKKVRAPPDQVDRIHDKFSKRSLKEKQIAADFFKAPQLPSCSSTQASKHRHLNMPDKFPTFWQWQ